MMLRILLLFLCWICASIVQAATVVTNISAKVVGIDGNKMPMHLGVGDPVTFKYKYDDAGHEAHEYYLDGRVETVSMSIYPHLTALSDAEAIYSPNLTELFIEYQGSSGYPYFNSAWVYMDNIGVQTFHSKIKPSAIVYMNYNPSEGLSPFFSEGLVMLWAIDPITNANFLGAKVTLDFISIDTVQAPVSLPGTAWLMLSGISLIGFCKCRVV